MDEGKERILGRQSRWRQLNNDRAAVVGAAILTLVFIASCTAALVESWLGVSGVETDLLSRLAPPSARHILGADEAGRDELVRLLRAGQTSLTIGLIGALGASLIGTLIGAVSGYFRGRVDMVLMRFTDFMMALPHLPILIILAALDLSKLGFSQQFINSGAAGYWRIVLIMTLLGWTGVARLVRGSTLELSEREFVLAARALGAGTWRILGRHVVPNAITPVIVATTIAVGRIILTESGLSFLGLGIQPPLTSWGNMLNNAQELLGIAPMLAILPGALILLTVIAINFLGDGLQAAFDPRRDIRY